MCLVEATGWPSAPDRESYVNDLTGLLVSEPSRTNLTRPSSSYSVYVVHFSAGAPSPASLTQIVSTGDATGDGRTDFFATAGDELWALTGYHGATVDQAIRLSASAWTERDIVTVLDITGDGVTDMVYRTDVHSQLMLRKGKAASGGGTDLDSLSSGADASGGTDLEYGSADWSVANVPLLIGTPDANGDGIPDIWVVRADGSVRFHAGGKIVLIGSGTEIIAPASYWKTRIAIG
ncbi:hypothetical protein SsS58_01206 [Streptomyces scabiei]|uniref:FG-GAP repeat protein n=1 Tax=Streptomyces scabiei TaxID=1930 RepID=A0A100JJV5_STRSC|nr:hypothetical protein SsS58_01206 [Streptomyces scabiei]